MNQKFSLFLTERALYKLIVSFVILISFTVNTGCISLISKDSSERKTPYKTLAITKATAEALAKTAKAMYMQGLISDSDLNKVKDTYNLCSKANDAAIDAMIFALDSGIVPHTSPNYLSAIVQLDNLLTDLLKLSKELKIKY